MKAVVNRKANYNYRVIKRYEAGIVLTGPEVKSAKNGQIDISSAYVSFLKDGPYLSGATISPYKYTAFDKDYDPQRLRKLLLKKKEIYFLKGKIFSSKKKFRKTKGKTGQKGLTLIVLKVYTKRNRIKLEIGLAQGKSRKDKRDTIQKREVAKQIKQYFKQKLRE